MPFVPAPNVVSVEIRAQKAGERVENRIHVNVLTPPTPAILTNLANIVITRIRTSWLAQWPTDVSLTELYLTDQTTQFGPTLTLPALVTDVGTRAGPPLPNHVTLCYSLRTFERGRSRRGRLYWLGFQEGDVSSNSVEPVFAEQVRSSLGSLRTDIEAAGFLWVVTSYVENGVARVTAASTTITSVALVNTIVDSQRRRLPGRGV